ncbi:hypothetical protein BH10BAC3_BH10BAC3_00290 [soil metagenome]
MQQESKRITLESTLKSSDTEELIDVYFYRPIGYQWALLFRRLHVTPNMVTIASIFIGITAGILFYPDGLKYNIIGMLLLMLANSFDSADGQLARMTNTKSRLGRILDGMAGTIWFIVITITLTLRLRNEGWSPLIWILGVTSGISHLIQSQQSDYYRNIHLYFIKGKAGSEQDNSKELNSELQGLSWSSDFWEKLILTLYRNYTWQQEKMSPKLQKLMGLVRNRFEDNLPQWLVDEFREMNRPLMKYTNIVQFNTRVIFLFFCLFINKVWLYFLFDLIVLNGILIYMIVRQEKVSHHFYRKLRSKQIA